MTTSGALPKTQTPKLAGWLLIERDARAALAVLGASDLGSLRDLEIARASAWLLKVARVVEQPCLIVDLDLVKNLGAAFLGCLVEAAKLLRSRHRRLVVCGCHRDVTRGTRLDTLMTVLTNRVDALQHCAELSDSQPKSNGNVALKLDFTKLCKGSRSDHRIRRLTQLHTSHRKRPQVIGELWTQVVCHLC